MQPWDEAAGPAPRSVLRAVGTARAAVTEFVKLAVEEKRFQFFADFALPFFPPLLAVI